jgi:hypothetical protein
MARQDGYESNGVKLYLSEDYACVTTDLEEGDRIVEVKSRTEDRSTHSDFYFVIG